MQGLKTLGALQVVNIRLAQASMSQADDRYNRMMHLLTDEAKEGPRLISIEPVDPASLIVLNRWRQKFRLTLWCEHSRQPLPCSTQTIPHAVFTRSS